VGLQLGQVMDKPKHFSRNLGMKINSGRRFSFSSIPIKLLNRNDLFEYLVVSVPYISIIALKI